MTSQIEERDTATLRDHPVVPSTAAPSSAEMQPIRNEDVTTVAVFHNDDAPPVVVADRLALAVSEEEQKKREKTALGRAMVFCLCFMVCEVVAGYLAHSLAILTDATHLMTDVGAYALSIFAIHATSRGATAQYSFGWHRAEVVGTLFSVFTIWALVGAIFFEAVNRIIIMRSCAFLTAASDASATVQCVAVDSVTLFVIGVMGLLVNFGCAGILYLGGSHGHSHDGGGGCGGHDEGGHDHGGHDHHCEDHDGHAHHEEEDGINKSPAKPEKQHESHTIEKVTGFALNAAFIHALSDCVQSVGVIAAGAFLYIANNSAYQKSSYKFSPYNLADPLSSIFFAVVTLNMTRSLVGNLLQILMEATPSGINYERVYGALLSIEKVEAIHDLHIWSLSAGKVALSVHLVSDSHEAVLSAAQQVLESKFQISHHTIQVDATAHGASKCGSNICSH